MSKAEELLGREISRINRHLPSTRPTLAELIGMDEPSVVLRDGSRHYFRKSELEYLKSLLDEEDAESLRVPIILEISTLHRGYFRVRGKAAVKVIDIILDEYNPHDEKEEALYPRYLLPRIRRNLPTTTTYAFITE
ncbi:MAG: DUF61 family protein [Thermococcus sp.]|nr:DUF61 family protein [Thermococcus sp.]